MRIRPKQLYVDAETTIRAWKDPKFAASLPHDIRSRVAKSPAGQHSVNKLPAAFGNAMFGTASADCNTASSNCNTASSNCNTASSNCNSASSHCNTAAASCNTASATCNSAAASCTGPGTHCRP